MILSSNQTTLVPPHLSESYYNIGFIVHIRSIWEQKKTKKSAKQWQSKPNWPCKTTALSTFYPMWQLELLPIFFFLKFFSYQCLMINQLILPCRRIYSVPSWSCSLAWIWVSRMISNHLNLDTCPHTAVIFLLIGLKGKKKRINNRLVVKMVGTRIIRWPLYFVLISTSAFALHVHGLLFIIHTKYPPSCFKISRFIASLE